MTERPTYPKSTCCIPGCPRWSRLYPADQEWICGRHWRAIPRRCRRALLKVWRRIEAGFNGAAAGRSDPIEVQRDQRLAARLWAHGRRAVILREAGL